VPHNQVRGATDRCPGGWPYHRGAVQYLDQEFRQIQPGWSTSRTQPLSNIRWTRVGRVKHVLGHGDPSRPTRTSCTPSRCRLTPATSPWQYTKNRPRRKPLPRLLVRSR